MHARPGVARRGRAAPPAAGRASRAAPARRAPRSPWSRRSRRRRTAPKPRESQVSTLKPARRSGPTPTLPVVSSLPAFRLACACRPSRGSCRIVGARWPACSPWAECRVTTIGVPSKDVTTASRAWAGAAPPASSASDAGEAGEGASERDRSSGAGRAPSGRARGGSRVVARQRRGHAVLEPARPVRADAVHEERERDPVAAAGLAVAGERRDAGTASRSWPGSRRAPRCGASGRRSVPVRPATASEPANSPRLARVHRREQPRRRRAATCGWRARAPSRRPRAGAAPSSRDRRARTTRAPGRRAPAAAELRAERLEQGLGDEVVRRRRSCAATSVRHRRRGQLGQAHGLRRRDARRARGGATRTPRRSSAALERLGGEQRRAGLEAAAGAGRCGRG